MENDLKKLFMLNQSDLSEKSAKGGKNFEMKPRSRLKQQP